MASTDRRGLLMSQPARDERGGGCVSPSCTAGCFILEGLLSIHLHLDSRCPSLAFNLPTFTELFKTLHSTQPSWVASSKSVKTLSLQGCGIFSSCTWLSVNSMRPAWHSFLFVWCKNTFLAFLLACAFLDANSNISLWGGEGPAIPWLISQMAAMP